MPSLVSVVIPTCGKNNYYISCLESLVQQEHSLLDIILIDNSMDPAVAVRSLEACSSVRVVCSKTVSSYCDSMNKGIEMSRGEYVFCLNDDVTLDPSFIAEALKGFLVNARIGMVSGKMLRQDKETLDSTGLFVSFSRTAEERGYGKRDQGQFQNAEFIFGVSGAAAFYRKAMLDEVREGCFWFDPCFRFFYEDLDLAWRAQRKGWKAYYIPKALAYHVRGGSIRGDSGHGKSFARRYLSDEMHADLIKNRYLMIIRNETIAGFVIHLPLMLLYDLCAGMYMVLFRFKAVKVFFSKSECIGSALRRRCLRRGVE